MNVLLADKYILYLFQGQKCNICNKIFANLTALTAHMANKHANTHEDDDDDFETPDRKSFLRDLSSEEGSPIFVNIVYYSYSKQ